MKILSIAAALIFISTPAFCGATSDKGGGHFECEITGGGKDGFKLTVDNKSGHGLSCSGGCEVTKASGGTIKKTYSKLTAPDGHKTFIGGEGSQPGAPLSNPQVVSESCS